MLTNRWSIRRRPSRAVGQVQHFEAPRPGQRERGRGPRLDNRVDGQLAGHESDSVHEVEQSVVDEVVANEGAGLRGSLQLSRHDEGVPPRVRCALWESPDVLHDAPNALDRTEPEQRGLG